MRSTIFAFALVALTASATGCGPSLAVLRDPAPIYVANSSADQIRGSILGLLPRTHWRVESEAPNRILVALAEHGHDARVLITYDATNIWLQYVSSTNLHYTVDRSGRPRIHPNYNRWVDHLARQIAQATNATRGGAPSVIIVQ